MDVGQWIRIIRYGLIKASVIDNLSRLALAGIVMLAVDNEDRRRPWRLRRLENAGSKHTIQSGAQEGKVSRAKSVSLLTYRRGRSGDINWLYIARLVKIFDPCS